MKITTGILGCALVAGLMTFASDKAQAGGIGIDGSLYSPMKVKATTTYVDDNGKFKKVSFDNKDILTAANLDVKGATLTYNYEDGNVYVVVKNSGSYTTFNLTTNGNNETFLEVDEDEYISTEKDKNNGFEEQGQGALSVYFWQYTDDSEEDYNETDLYGAYSDKHSGSENNSGTKESYSLKAKSLAGSSYGVDSDYDDMPASGSVSISGSAKFNND